MLARWSTWALSALALAAASSGCGAPFTTSDPTSSTTPGTGGAGGTTTGPTTTGGAGGTGGMVTSATTGGGGTGGTGGMPECTMAEQCPGVDSECRTRTCTAGVCGFSTPMALAASQVWGDCKARGCDGQGNLVVANNPMDFYNDANECTIDTCEGNTPKNKPAQGILCNSGMGVCNDAGACVECVSNDNNTCPAIKHNCQAGRCVPLHCVDGFQDVNETA
ncbi:MAG: hypothetical protein U0359_21565, partial [Byssovorax sp.]